MFKKILLNQERFLFKEKPCLCKALFGIFFYFSCLQKR